MLLVCGVVALGFVLSDRSRWTVEKVERLIREEVSTGSNREQVEAWFGRHGIRHKDLGGGMMRGEIGPTDPKGRYFERIFIDFYFDEQGREVRHRVESFSYSF